MATLNLAVIKKDSTPYSTAITMGIDPANIKYVFAAPGQSPVVIYLDKQSVKLVTLVVTTGFATIFAGYSDWLMVNITKKDSEPMSLPALINKNSIVYQVQVGSTIQYNIMYNEGYEVVVRNKQLLVYIDAATVAAEAITAISLPLRRFTAAANLAVLLLGAPFYVTGSTAGATNIDGLYSAAADASATAVIVNQVIPFDPAANGTINA